MSVASSHRESRFFLDFVSEIEQHEQIVGPRSTTVPQAGLYTTARDGPLAQLIVKQLVANTSIDPNVELLYNPVQWRNANNQPFTATDDWLQPPVPKVINGRQDAFSQRYAVAFFPFLQMKPPRFTQVRPRMPTRSIPRERSDCGPV